MTLTQIDDVPSALAALATKYREMKKLREAQDVDVANGRTHAPIRDELRALSREFPGALAEIDRVSLSLIEARLAELEALCDRAPPPSGDALPRWVRAMIGVHRGLRGALSIKAWLAGRRVVDEAMIDALREALPSLAFSDDARIWIEDLPAIADPPRGRVVDLIFDRVAAELGTDRVTLRAELMPRHARDA